MRSVRFLTVLLLLLASCSSLRTLNAEPLPEPTANDHPAKETKKGTVYSPISGEVEEGTEYHFNTGHCGLDFMTDFDGSFWIPENPDEGDEPPEFFTNEDDGTMKLISEGEAEYTSSGGVMVSLQRHQGPFVLRGACA